MGELAGKDVILKISGEAVTMTGEATTPAADDKTYQITAATKQVIDWETQPVVKVGGSVTSEAHTIDYLGGRVIFHEADSDRGVVTIDGKYLPMSVVGYATSMSRSTECDLLDANVFGSEYKKRIAGMKSASGTLSQIDMTDEIYLEALKAGKPIVLEDVAESGGDVNRVLALLENVEEAADATALQQMTIGWTSKNKYLILGV